MTWFEHVVWPKWPLYLISKFTSNAFKSTSVSEYLLSPLHYCKYVNSYPLQEPSIWPSSSTDPDSSVSQSSAKSMIASTPSLNTLFTLYLLKSPSFILIYPVLSIFLAHQTLQFIGHFFTCEHSSNDRPSIYSTLLAKN